METPNAERPAEHTRSGHIPEAPAEKGGARKDAAQAGAAPGKNPAPPPAAGPAHAAPGVGGLRPSDVDFMPGLLRSLSVLMRLRGKPVSPQLLLSGLSGSQITPRALLRKTLLLVCNIPA